MESLDSDALGQVCLQVQLNLASLVAAGAIEQFAESVARATPGVRGFEVTRGNEDGEYLNLSFAAEQPIEAWRALRSRLFESSEFGATLRASSISVCTGEDGWNDYLLLFHFDPSVETELGA